MMAEERKEKSSWLEPLPEEYAGEENMTSRRMIIAAITVVVLAIFAGVIWYSYMQGADKGPVPVVRADKSVIKVKPDDPGGMKVPHQDKEIFEQVAGAGSEKEEVLGASSEIPMDRPSVDAPAAGDLNVALPPNPPVEEGDAEAKTVAEAEQAAEQISPAASAPTPSVTERETGDFMIQLGAFSQLASAEKLWANLAQKHGDLLAGLTPDYMVVDLGEKGVLYRVRGGNIEDRDAADRICDQLKKAGQGCMVVKK
ncbi:SPOR domain-containing protein [Emcibacter sp.]|uniref:SPOR domain-containing protein n=1 Tax=Emcibacter sp. TaxID=1979954 RepID=UPI002AA813F5|nr:SPOR domain-containing protein [Emcibacter sp.]